MTATRVFLAHPDDLDAVVAALSEARITEWPWVVLPSPNLRRGHVVLGRQDALEAVERSEA